MPLEEYHRKRDFGQTPEPAGSVSSHSPITVRPVGQARFVVQRHRATRLHYDFRLEIGGVLVSWAVPRGPTLDPGQRRMAIHVEDHPIEYFDFEGVIPARQYGAGDVIVWDWGTWSPETETPDPAAAIAAGELKFRLDGQKLHGRFTIVRTSGRGGARRRGGDDPGARAFEDDDGDQWLLIHKRDEHAVPGWDAEDHPASVSTGRTNDDVAANRDALWIGSAPAASAEIDLSAATDEPMPAFIEPMLATLASRPFSDPDWLFEIKWDGYRVQAVVRDGKVRLWTRNRHDAEAYFPGLLSPPSWLDAREAIVDGEVVALDAAGRPDFGLLQERLGGTGGSGSGRSGPDPDGASAGTSSAALVYEAFDLLHVDGRSLLRVPLIDRKRLLRAVLREDRHVRYSAHVEAEGLAFHEAAAAQGLEGVVAKQRRSSYEPGRRSATWLKLKIRPEQELVVGGWTPGEGSARDLGAVAVGVYEDGALRFVGKVGSGFDARTRRVLRERFAALEVDAPPFDPPPSRDHRGRWGGDLSGIVWLRPEIVIRAEIGGWSRDGMVRQSAFKGIEEGRDPAEVTRERAIDTETAVESVTPAQAEPEAPARDHLHSWTATDAELAALAALGREGAWSVGGSELKLTNLDKALFPARPDELDGGATSAPPITKRELIAYFARIAPTMLPHLAERPLNLNRFPDGALGKSFWQKDIPSTAPSWLRRWREAGVEAREANEHLVADRVGALCWLGNQAAFEIHAWTSRLDAPWRPTFALIDIDPGERTTWEETLTLARLYRTALGHLGVRGYPKVTGKRGIQVWIPIEPRYTYADTSAWVERLSRAVGATVPDLVSWEWSKDARGGRARLDYTQNAPIKTLVAPYAVRPAAGAPVSAPISWEELDHPALRPDTWTIRTIVERVTEVGDLFAPAQSDLQVLPPL